MTDQEFAEELEERTKKILKFTSACFPRAFIPGVYAWAEILGVELRLENNDLYFNNHNFSEMFRKNRNVQSMMNEEFLTAMAKS